MPLWDYVCDACGRKETVAFSTVEERDRTKVLCTKACDGNMILQPCSGSFILKGAGFHQNDYPKGKG